MTYLVIHCFKYWKEFITEKKIKSVKTFLVCIWKCWLTFKQWDAQRLIKRKIPKLSLVKWITFWRVIGYHFREGTTFSDLHGGGLFQLCLLSTNWCQLGCFCTQTGGIQVKIKEYERFVCGTLAQCHADNLGSHCIGGFMESFKATKPCRVCDGTRDDFQTKV